MKGKYKEEQMRYIINIPKHLLDEIRKVLEKGEYNNVNELIITSIENQLTLESGEIIQEDLFSTVVKKPKYIPKEAHEKEGGLDYSKWLSVKNLGNIKTFPLPEIKDLEQPNSNYNDYWLWGQINRIFPIKVGLRVLVNMQQEKEDFVLLDDFHKHAGEIARGFGQKLAGIDNQLKRKRDERVSTALPMGEKEEKAVGRYVSQFLAIKRTNGILDGAMARLKFVNIQSRNEKEASIGLTKEGLEFAKLKNPILDEDLQSENTLSVEEADLYISHIRNHVPEELNPIKTILHIIKNGATTVTEIDREMKKIKPGWTDVVVTTQRSGALGRMSELGLLEKNKKGVKVTYRISERGKKLINITIN